MTIPEAVQLVIQAGSIGTGGEVFVLDMGEPVKILDLAKDLIKLSGLKLAEDIDIEITGLRSGEKLYEELLNDNEDNIATDYDRIFITRLGEIDLIKLEKAMKELRLVVRNGDTAGIIKLLVELVGTYKPNRDNIREIVYDREKLSINEEEIQAAEEVAVSSE